MLRLPIIAGASVRSVRGVGSADPALRVFFGWVRKKPTPKWGRKFERVATSTTDLANISPCCQWLYRVVTVRLPDGTPILIGPWCLGKILYPDLFPEDLRPMPRRSIACWPGGTDLSYPARLRRLG